LSEVGVLFSVVMIVFALVVILVERKLLAYAMRRVGPMLMGRNGAFQILLDLVKLLSKETFLIPRPTSVLAPIFLTLFFACQLLFAQNYVWGPSMFLYSNVDSMILYHLVLILLSNIFFTVIGFLSQSRYALIAVARSLVHVISLDIFVTVVYSMLVFSAQSANFHDFIVMQNHCWFFILYSPIASGFLILFLLESKRTPFDHAETEAEVVAGYATEYNGTMLLFLYLTEYIHLIIASVHFVVFFFGGWYLLSYFWFLPTAFLTPHDSLYWLSLFRLYFGSI
jgi:NADH:ubiquinone oxidoreductase subunit H